MKIFLVGYGNVGKAMHEVLKEQNILVDFVVRKNGIYAFSGASDSVGSKVNERENFSNYLNGQSIVIVSVPSSGRGEEAALYYTESMKKGAIIVTCEKAFLAHHWEMVKGYKKIKYGATVGGNSGILSAVSHHKGQIEEIRAVVNGTLNYIADALAKGADKQEVYKEVMDKGFAEPGSSNFEEVISNELNDVACKAAILANHSKLFEKSVEPEDIVLAPYKDGLRCSVLITKDKIEAGFLAVPDRFSFPTGVNNVLYINNQKVVEGPGAGGKATALRMLKELLEEVDLTMLHRKI